MRNRATYWALVSAGVALRLWFVIAYPVVQGDTLIYADIAKNWLHNGVFGFSSGAEIAPTLIRLPGYPAFLAAMFAMFGDNNFVAVMLLQALVDMLTCWAIAALAAELVTKESQERTRRWAFALAAVCPFTANYVALPLTETLSIATTAWALLFAVKSIPTLSLQKQERQGWGTLVLCGIFAAIGCVLRPDNGIVMAVICGTLLLAGRTRRPASQSITWRGLKNAMTVGIIAVLPLLPWTIRNWRTFHVLQPLAPRYANNPDESVPRGFNRWMKTWVVDYVSTSEIYWRADDSTQPADPDDLPNRAFDSTEQRARTYALFYDIPGDGYLTPEMDAKFAELARERIRAHPLRYYVLLPLARSADMWFRPRTEMLDIDARWWQFDDKMGSWVSIGLMGLNLVFVSAAMAGLFRARWEPAIYMLVVFVVVRTLFLGTLENPESRYTLECFPVVLAMAGVAISSRRG